MNRIVLAGGSPAVEAHVRTVTDAWPQVTLHVLPAPLPADAATLLGALGPGPAPDVVVLGPLAAPHLVLALAAGLTTAAPHTSVVLVGELDADALLDALRCGVRDVLVPGAGLPELRTALERAARAALAHRPAAVPAPRAEATRPQVITVVSPKGGVGKTTVATNLAVGLAAAEPHSTVVVDLDMQFGDVASALQLSPESSVLEAVGASGADTMVLKTFLTPHPSGLYSLCAPEHPAGADQVTGDQVAELLRHLSRQFRHVVVDTSAGLTEHTLGALEVTTDLLLVCGMDVPSVRALRKETDVLDELGLATAARRVVLNSVDARSGLTVKDIEGMLGRTIDVSLPRSREVTLSTNRGVPLLAAGSKDAVAKELSRLVGLYLPAVRPAGRRALSLLGSR